ncbi:MAG: translocation/assembly module TamB domain-containing protein [Kiritimatiellae bacterium]|nr:translocation/assembly module TamB domain-containing protein [Kiritimatiellia bacterium]
MFGFTDRIGPGTELEGLFTLSGTLGDPTATLKLDLSGLRPEDPELWDGPPAQFQVELALSEQRLKGGFHLKNLPGDPVTLDLDIPAPLSLLPFSFQWPPEGPVDARLSANTDLAGLGSLFVLEVYHRLVGTLAADITLSGTFDDPRLEGSIRLDGGRYEHEISGTILSDIVLDVAAEREFLSLVNFSASDGAEGSVHASGRLQFKPGERYPFESTLTLNRFRLVHNDHAEAMGRGTVNWNGNVDESNLSGQVRVSPMTLNIPETLPPRLYALEVVEVYGDEDVEEVVFEQEEEAVSRPPRHRVTFDLRIDAPDRVFVRGRGLDSEWSARIQVRGQTPEPTITGSLNIIRGRFSFFGKRLVLQRGIVTFDGAFPPEPLLDVEATLRSGGITAILRVQGPAADPEIELDSSPPMPQDEILARLLFGREAARITPWQAITLAQAVNKIRGGGSAFDLMGETRRVLRVDQVDVRTPDDEQDGTTVTVGKYISDRVYVELERNVAEESGRAGVEVELTPSLRLETQIGGNADSGIGIIWTRDF